MGSKKLQEIIQTNLNTLMEQDMNTSMRNLSTCIGASDGYIQKIMSGNSLPSLDKLEDISEHYEVELWSLLYDYGDDKHQILPIIQQINRLPVDEIPVVAKYLEFLIEQNKK
jgi:transcriptional regulator with XRE-family HTH domain